MQEIKAKVLQTSSSESSSGVGLGRKSDQSGGKNFRTCKEKLSIVLLFLRFLTGVLSP